jgi:enamine deaminase RidA (YjgF/YER057c/UK114 family)
MNLQANARHPLTIRFGQETAVCREVPHGLEVELPLPVLSGPEVEILVEASAPGEEGGQVASCGRFTTLRQASSLAGVCVCPLKGDLETQSYHAYRDLFQCLGDTYFPYRIWHYIPDINGKTGDMENYRIFNMGRRRAFDDHFGSLAERQMPAASAVGTPGHHFVMAFVAGTRPPRYLENPQQTPAYHYPAIYGPKSPSFARAAIATPRVYISGTASIRGHQTVHQGNLVSQLGVTADNLEHLARGLGLATWKEVARRPDYRLKVYLRHARDLASLQPALKELLQASPSNTTIVESDICRSDLDVEIEAGFSLESEETAA